MYLSDVVDAEKQLEYAKKILRLMFMIMAKTGWVKKSNSGTRDISNAIIATMKSPSEYLAMNVL